MERYLQALVSNRMFVTLTVLVSMSARKQHVGKELLKVFRLHGIKLNFSTVEKVMIEDVVHHIIYFTEPKSNVVEFHKNGRSHRLCQFVERAFLRYFKTIIFNTIILVKCF